MARAAEAAAPPIGWAPIGRQVIADLMPMPGRLALTWRVALLVALVAGVAMLYRIPESAIGCYLIIFLARPNGAEGVAQAIGIIVLASIVVVAMAPLIQFSAESALLRLVIMAAMAFLFVFLGAATQLGEQGSIVGLVIVYILSLVDRVPAGEIVTRGLLYAWQMACVPMAMMIAFNLVLGASPHRLLQEMTERRLRAAASALDGEGEALDEELAEGNAEVAKRAQLAGLFHTAPRARVRWLSGAAMNGYRLLLLVAALPREAGGAIRESLAARCRAAADAIRSGGRPDPAPPLAEGDGVARMIEASLDGFARDDGGTAARPLAPPFLAPDAFTNPDYQRYALKTAAAAMTCYLIYSLLDWPGISTAMVTCFVAALGTTAETVHKLALRIGGCLIGAAMGFLSILFIIPHLESVGGLMALVFCAILPAAWVSTGNERISYAGVQIGLAFLLTILNGFGPDLSMDSGRDRIIGILLGNLVVYLYFTGLWSKSAADEARERLARLFAALSRLTALDPAARGAALAEAEMVAIEAEKAREQLALLPFEPASRRPDAGRIAAALDLLAEARALLPQLMVAPAADEAAAARLAAVSARLGGRDRPEMHAPDGEADAPGGPIGRIETLAAGLA
ncbi:FUSC family protein [Kaistia geumhonensis]|uniref:Multidrug resistance protein MdtO n=1 Tax=Kaistia geumhonensis TaxID=410839 RepID=A0ABU0M7L2_9HYPH|nr:FUSC family protein [Kaistia geumhonensis]MCX5477992.1 FUSC family protein [Kaistia geumhonensis]MDQ0516795.1 multidrug resistance protein MdtO [Kaistia geumhonensis]